ncbi:protein kinase family protein [Rhynchospora pubera]|uniref:Protein kinase family protein n=1 Tax=Rhynchospora pubera TaxID=906938 RepID=A0AAV8DQ55_9POAL|nr:protein kinase family protein [Rhynchospora pubera]
MVPVIPLAQVKLKKLTPPLSIIVPQRSDSTRDNVKSFAPVEDDAYEIRLKQMREEKNAGMTVGGAVNSYAELISKKADETVGFRENLKEEREQCKVGISSHGSLKRTISSWMKGNFLGSCSFGKVYEAIDQDGFFFAVKEGIVDQGINSYQSMLQLEQEILLLSKLQHENIVQYYGTERRDGNLYIFYELAQGSLASLYQTYRFQDSQVSAYTRQILKGMSYLHYNSIIHRDIKCANILVATNGCVKLADLALAVKIDPLNEEKFCMGSVYWMAPEVVNPKKPYGVSADIWSLGCTVLEMLTGEIPYRRIKWREALFKIGRGERPLIPKTLSRDARDFIDKCLQVNPEDRPSATALLQHPFIRPRS